MEARQYDQAINLVKSYFCEVNDVTSLNVYDIETDLGIQAMTILTHSVNAQYGPSSLYPILYSMEMSGHSSPSLVNFVYEVIIIIVNINIYLSLFSQQIDNINMPQRLRLPYLVSLANQGCARAVTKLNQFSTWVQSKFGTKER